MKKFKVKLFPLIMTVLSFLYIVYVYLSEETSMSADAVGGDPGGKVLPYIMGFIIFAGSLYKTVTDRSNTGKLDSDTKFLFVLTLCFAVAYIILNKLVGFVLLTVILLYVTLYMYSTIGEKRSFKEATLGGVLTMVCTVAVYYIFRFVSKKLLKLGRAGVLPIFKSSSATACVALVVVSIFLSVFIVLFAKKLKNKGLERVWTSSIVTFATTLYLYIIFKQFFAVSLAPGLLKY